ncbi:569_t:CDS:2 [Funneliformis mosseae]|uniref:569_t:CDS:1 n=1 Tax=Funneliformis mosseae TaxID=27381 RepID=A0A9N9G176_FUNMO|nr:569_t:CDS:2 [Funneliformis mosseae]
MSEKKLFTLAELAEHNHKKSLYVSIKGKVYDVTKFIDEHPGGEEVLLDEGGSDATEAFEDVGHSDEAHDLLKTYEIGELKDGPPIPSQKSQPSYPKPQPAETSNLVNYLLPVAVVAAYVVYKIVASE